MMLHRVFELQSYSKYDDKIFQTPGSNSFASVGHQPMGEPWEDFYRRKQQEPGLHLIKTHDAPLDGNPAIYVVRNGFAAVNSYRDFCRVYDRKDYPLEDLILGSGGPYPSWGAHLDGWNPRQRPNTLLLKYRDLLENPDICLSQLAGFLNRPRQQPWTNNFTALHQESPDFFRRGKLEPTPASYTPAQLELFELIHGDWLAELGYTMNQSIRHPLCRTLRAAIQPRDAMLAHQQALDSANREIAVQTAAAVARLGEILRKEQEIRNLKHICDEREQLIQRLSSPAERRTG